MASTYSSSLRLELITPGEQANTWGITTNVNLGTLIEQAISGYTTVNMASDADRTLTTANGSSDESRPAALKITSSGSLTATRNIIVPTANKLYSIKNATTGSKSLLVKTTAGTGITIPNGETATVICDGTNVVYAFSAAGMGLMSSSTILPITSGGTGQITAAAALTALSGVKYTATTGSAVLPLGTTAQRDGGTPTGYLRYNTTLAQFEGYGAAGWGKVGGGATGGATDAAFYENDQTITTDYTITAGKNAMSAGTISIASGVTVTVGTGQTWSIV